MKSLHYLHKAVFFLPFVFLCTVQKCFCQNIIIGQSAEQVKGLVNYEVESYRRAQGYHPVRMDYSVKYKNGQISEVILCKENAPMIDLPKAVDFCTHFIMANGHLATILLQYSNISISELESVMNKSNIHIGSYYFSNNQDTYSKVYLSTTGLAIKEIKSKILNPLPATIENQLSALQQQMDEESDNNYNPSDAIDYKEFIPQKTNICYSVLEGMIYKKKINKRYVSTVSPSLKAIIAYYTAISNAYDLTQQLGLGKMCSSPLLEYISMYIKNKELISQISNCAERAANNKYSLNRLELTEQDSVVTVSFCMTYFEDNISQDNVISLDKFKIGENGLVTVLNLSSKESFQRRSAIINTRVYDIKDTDSVKYENFKTELKNELFRILKSGNYQIPSFKDILNNMNRANFTPSWSVNNSYNLDWKTEDNSSKGRLVGNTWIAGSDETRLIQNNSLNRGNDNEFQFLKDCRVYIPNIKVEGIDVIKKTLVIKDVNVDFQRGITFVKIKNDNIEYIKYPPSAATMEKIKNKLSGIAKGTYLIQYEFGNVMGEDYENIISEKVKSDTNWMIKAGGIGLGLL
jgi:hypothetical protein